MAAVTENDSALTEALVKATAQVQAELLGIEAQGRDLDPMEADAFFAAVTALSVGSYYLAEVCLQVARGERNLRPPLPPAPAGLGVAGIRAALMEIKDSHREADNDTA